MREVFGKDAERTASAVGVLLYALNPINKYPPIGITVISSAFAPKEISEVDEVESGLCRRSDHPLMSRFELPIFISSINSFPSSLPAGLNKISLIRIIASETGEGDGEGVGEGEAAGEDSGEGDREEEGSGGGE